MTRKVNISTRSSGNTSWLYQGNYISSIDDIPQCCPYMTYRIDFIDGYYYGSKQIYSTRNVKISKKRANELWSGKGRKPTKEVKIKENDWKTYKSSSKLVNEKLNNNETAKFQIVKFHETKTDMLLHEALLIITAFLHKDQYCLNGWVSVRQNKPKL